MVGIQELLQAAGVQLKKVSAKEYHSPCPVCGGTDRFITWPGEGESGRSWCRQCNINLDSISYLMEAQGMTFLKAAEYVGKSIKYSPPEEGSISMLKDVPICIQKETTEPTSSWSKMASNFTTWAADNLHENSKQLERLQSERGISPATVDKWRLGWNPSSMRRPGEKWGIEGNIFFPEGLVIPNKRDGHIISVKIRRERGEPKYHLIRGSKVFPYMLSGDVSGTIAVVEGELDALLLWETARDVLAPISFGGCSNKPDIESAELMARAEILLDCMDNDPAGDAAGEWLRNWFPNCIRWKPTQKDPGAMFQTGKNVRKWVFNGIKMVLNDRSIWPGKLDFYEALDSLADPFPPEQLRELSEEQIERLALMMD
jgi:DNA primase